MSQHGRVAKIYDDLKQRIISGEYLPHASLNEVKLASQYGVSRNTVKKVLLMLKSENLVIVELNKGAKVKSVSIEDIKEFLELRVILEQFIVEKTVPIISEKDIDEMKKFLELMKRNVQERNLLEYTNNNFLFHDVIYRACPSKKAVEMTTS